MKGFESVISAAYIQGSLGVLAALIGAAVVIFSIKSTTTNAVKQIKFDKVAESKRDQYIALTDAYTHFLVSSLLLKNKSKDLQSNQTDLLWNSHLSKYIELIGCINKVNLITTSLIRLELYKLENSLASYQTSISNHYFNNHPVDSSEKLQHEVFKFAQLLRDDLSIENDKYLESKLAQLKLEKLKIENLRIR